MGLVGLDSGAGQEVVVFQDTQHSPGPQAVLTHVGSTVEVSKPCRTQMLHVSDTEQLDLDIKLFCHTKGSLNVSYLCTVELLSPDQSYQRRCHPLV